MAGRPVFDGALQLTDRLSVALGVAVTVGAAGASGGSSTSVRLIVTAADTLTLPSSTVTVTA